MKFDRSYKYERLLKKIGVELTYTDPILRETGLVLGSKYQLLQQYSVDLIQELQDNYSDLPEIKKITKIVNDYKSGKPTYLKLKLVDPSYFIQINDINLFYDKIDKSINQVRKFFNTNGYKNINNNIMVLTYSNVSKNDVINLSMGKISCLRAPEYARTIDQLLKFTLETTDQIYTIPDEDVIFYTMLKFVEIFEKLGFEIK